MSVAQLDLLEYAAQEALRRRQAGMARVLDNDTEYRERLLSAIETLAMQRKPFTADDARALAGDPPADVHYNISGAAFSASAKAGTIRFTGTYALSTRIVGHGNLLRVWIGVAA